MWNLCNNLTPSRKLVKAQEVREYCGSYDGAEVRPQFVLGSEGARLRMFMPQHDMQCLVLKIEPAGHMRKVEYLCILCSDDS
jgi:hypothetical protein